MPNRTIYLPDELDRISRRLELNLSQVVQQAIRTLDAEQSSRDLASEVKAASERARALEIDWSGYDLDETRRSAGER